MPSAHEVRQLAMRFGPLVIVPILLAVPFLTNGYYTFLVSLGLSYGILSASLDLQWGYVGLINFGAAAPFGIGAYTYGLLNHWFGLTSTWVLLAASAVIGGGYTAILGLAAFLAKSKALYYALLTMAGALLIGQVATTAGFTNGSNGMNGLPNIDLSLPGLPSVSVGGSTGTYYVVLGFTALCILPCLWLVRSPFGRVLDAIRRDDHRTGALGYSTIKYKLVVVGLSGCLAGAGGGLFAVVNGSINPTLFGLSVSLLAFIWVAIGGQGTMWGPFAAAIVLNVLEAYMSTVNSDLYLVVLALIFIVIVLLLPKGLAGLVVRRFRASPRRSRSTASEESTGVPAS